MKVTIDETLLLGKTDILRTIWENVARSEKTIAETTKVIIEKWQ